MAICVCVCVCVCVCMRACVYMIIMCMHIHVYMCLCVSWFLIMMHICDQICQKGSYTRTVSRHTFHPHLLATSMHYVFTTAES